MAACWIGSWQPTSSVNAVRNMVAVWQTPRCDGALTCDQRSPHGKVFSRSSPAIDAFVPVICERV
jgi:hypothetical protein